MTLGLFITGTFKSLGVHELDDPNKIAERRQKLRFLFGVDDNDLDSLFRILNNNPDLMRYIYGIHCFIDIHCISYMKAFNSELSEDDPNNFYMEREWRVIGNIQFPLGSVERVIFPKVFASQFHNDFPDYRGQIQFAESI